MWYLWYVLSRVSGIWHLASDISDIYLGSQIKFVRPVRRYVYLSPQDRPGRSEVDACDDKDG